VRSLLLLRGHNKLRLFGVDPIIRVTTSFRTTAVTEPQVVPDAKAQETAPRALDGMAESECATLSEIFKAECRLSSLQIIFPLVTPANAPHGLYGLQCRTGWLLLICNSATISKRAALSICSDL
jgi:hypothetical protein